MTRRVKATVAAAAIGVTALAGAGIARAAGGGDEHEEPITGTALERASAAALEHTGGGRVTDTEVGDEESLYEVEVRLPDGRSVDVQLDKDFSVVGQRTDRESGDADN